MLTRRQFLKLTAAASATLLISQNLPVPSVYAQQPPPVGPYLKHSRITMADRQAAAQHAAEAGLRPGVRTRSRAAQITTPTQGSAPDYFGPYPNWANSALRNYKDANGVAQTGAGIRKFVNSLPGLGSAHTNNLGQYLTQAIPDQNTYQGCDYYEIELALYHHQFHSDVPSTLVEGYRQTNMGGTPWSYLGPVIVATKDRPVRIKFFNHLPAGSGGNLPIPCDTTIMGAGAGPNGGNYTENRATIHLHGGNSPWISDGTPHQWVTPTSEPSSNPYRQGDSVQYVPDMDGGSEGPGILTFFWTNQQSGRLMFYHDHALGITRLNVYVGQAAGYLITDSVEQDLINGTNNSGGNPGLVRVLPDVGFPLVIQDKTFVPPAAQMAAEDPTWNWGSGTLNGQGIRPWVEGDLWFPHVYMVNQNPWDPSGAAAMGRWDYGPWFWPPYTGLTYQPIVNPYYDPAGSTPWEPPYCPATPQPSLTPEAFMDTPVVNGTAYPFMQVGQKAYRFRILNACNDRMLNLQLYYAASNATMWNGSTLLDGNAGEVPMVPAAPNAGLPPTWPTDGRAGGVPDPHAVGPTIWQIGNEGGLLPEVCVLPNTPVGYEYNRRNIVVLNVSNHTLLIGPAERADVIVDFSGCPDGSKLIFYNDCPAPIPAGDPRLDYYTGDPDQTAQGGAPTTPAGYGPNTRTIMQFQVTKALNPTPNGPAAPPYDLALLQKTLPSAYAAGQHSPIIPQTPYNKAYNANFPNTFVRIQDTQVTFTPYGGATPVTKALAPKAIQELFTTDYGRMNAILGVEIPNTSVTNQTTIPYAYVDPSTEIIVKTNLGVLVGAAGDNSQIWKITHNGVDTHVIHFHLMDVQVINRVGWDGAVRFPDPNEVGWKDTVRMNPLEDCIVAVMAHGQEVLPGLPAWLSNLPNSVRAFNPTLPVGSTMGFTNVDPAGLGITVTNIVANFGHEYVWHCHILGHEENDMMRTICFVVPPPPPTNVHGTLLGNANDPTKGIQVIWTDQSRNETHWIVQRATSSNGPWTTIATIQSSTGPATGGALTYDDRPLASGRYYYQVIARNIVGDTTNYGAAPIVGYPNVTMDSVPAVTASSINRT